MNLSRFRISTQLMIILTGVILLVSFLFVALSVYSLSTVVKTANDSMADVKQEMDGSADKMDKDQTAAVAKVIEDADKVIQTLSVEHMSQMSGGISAEIQGEIENALGTARTLAKSIEGYKSGTPIEALSRETILQLVSGIKKGNPNFLAVWLVFEPNAFDNRDAEFKGRGTDLGCDAEGRFLPWYYNDKTNFAIAPLEDVETSDFYAPPKRLKQEYVTNPMMYEGINMVSATVPIIVNNEFIGVAGVDIAITYFDQVLSGHKPYDTGYVYMINSDGIFIWHPDHSFIEQRKNVKDLPGREQIVEAVQQGKSLEITVNDLTTGRPLYQILSTMKFGKSPNVWGLVISAEQDKVLANMYTIEEMLHGLDTMQTEATNAMQSGIEETNVAAQKTFAANNTRIAWVITTCVIIMFLCSLVVAYFIGRSFSNPIQEGVGLLRGIAETGHITTDAPAYLLKRKDEIGDLGRCIGLMLGDYRSIADINTQLADRNWKLDAKVKSEEDTMNINLNIMLDRVNEALKEIQDNVGRVTTGASEVSNAATSLSSGSQEAAASLEEITASMSEISSQTKANAANAGQARELAQTTSKAVEQGQESMEEMVSAMDQITKNSSEIQRVIKVIDDIAFQTNLLALNAAVEAARAGQHGKGFAVVAEEVRNLAARSAKAAQETSELIAKSGQQIEKGGQVASHTAEVLHSMVDHITKMTNIVGDIAVASNEQAQGVGQVTIGLQQIDSVTQQNTAAAEESASAANEMSALAKTLHELVGQFQLRA